MLICDSLIDSVPFIQYKKHEKHPWRCATFSNFPSSKYFELKKIWNHLDKIFNIKIEQKAILVLLYNYITCFVVREVMTWTLFCKVVYFHRCTFVCSYVWTGHYFNLISYIQLWVLRAKWFLSKTLVFNFWSKLPNMALTWWYSSIFSWRFTSKWMKVNHDISNVGKSHTFPQSKTNWKNFEKGKRLAGTIDWEN